jgi:hypothetical protein
MLDSHDQGDSDLLHDITNYPPFVRTILRLARVAFFKTIDDARERWEAGRLADLGYCLCPECSGYQTMCKLCDGHGCVTFEVAGLYKLAVQGRLQTIPNDSVDPTIFIDTGTSQ